MGREETVSRMFNPKQVHTETHSATRQQIVFTFARTPPTRKSLPYDCAAVYDMTVRMCVAECTSSSRALFMPVYNTYLTQFTPNVAMCALLSPYRRRSLTACARLKVARNSVKPSHLISRISTTYRLIFHPHIIWYIIIFLLHLKCMEIHSRLR